MWINFLKIWKIALYWFCGKKWGVVLYAKGSYTRDFTVHEDRWRRAAERGPPSYPILLSDVSVNMLNFCAVFNTHHNWQSAKWLIWSLQDEEFNMTSENKIRQPLVNPWWQHPTSPAFQTRTITMGRGREYSLIVKQEFGFPGWSRNRSGLFFRHPGAAKSRVFFLHAPQIRRDWRKITREWILQLDPTSCDW